MLYSFERFEDIILGVSLHRNSLIRVCYKPEHQDPAPPKFQTLFEPSYNVMTILFKYDWIQMKKKK